MSTPTSLVFVASYGQVAVPEAVRPPQQVPLAAGASAVVAHFLAVAPQNAHYLLAVSYHILVVVIPSHKAKVAVPADAVPPALAVVLASHLAAPAKPVINSAAPHPHVLVALKANPATQVRQLVAKGPLQVKQDLSHF